MKVLHVTSGNLYGGIETMLVAIARHRDTATRMDSQFAVCFEGRFRRELVGTGSKVHDLGAVRARNPMSVRRARLELLGTIEREGIDVVVCHSAWPLAIFGPAVPSSGRPLVLWQHGPLDGVFWLERWARRSRPSLVICNSRFTASSVCTAYDPSRVEVLYCPVPGHADMSQVLGPDRDALRSEFGAGPDDAVIVQVSRLEEGKGHRLHLEALARLRDTPGWVCWMIGGAQRPSERAFLAQLKALASDRGIADRVRFLGQRTDVMRLLSAADIHCQPNTHPEPFGITFVEALFAGLPVVATAMGGVLEIVDDTCGLLAQSTVPAAVAELLERLVGDPEQRRRLGRNGPARAMELCDPAIQIPKLERLLDRFGTPERASA